jgi:hypothetical protein
MARPAAMIAIQKISDSIPASLARDGATNAGSQLATSR